MSLDLTYAENADRALKCKGKTCSPAKAAANRKAALISTLVFLLLLAVALGVVYPDPIHAY